MENFIYVFDLNAKDALLNRGMKLLKDDKEKNIYVFQNDNKMNFDNSNFKFVLSNILTF